MRRLSPRLDIARAGEKAWQAKRNTSEIFDLADTGFEWDLLSKGLKRAYSATYDPIFEAAAEALKDYCLGNRDPKKSWHRARHGADEAADQAARIEDYRFLKRLSDMQGLKRRTRDIAEQVVSEIGWFAQERSLTFDAAVRRFLKEIREFEGKQTPSRDEIEKEFGTGTTSCDVFALPIDSPGHLGASGKYIQFRPSM